MAGLRAAMAVDGPCTVVQRGWRLGGKGASHFRNGRIEEHGLHVWLGYYDNAFKAIGETGPAGSHRETIDALFVPSDRVGLSDLEGSTWLARFSGNSLTPGEAQTPATMTVSEFARRAGALVTDLVRSSLIVAPEPVEPRVRLSGSPRRRTSDVLSPRQLVELADTALLTGLDQVLRLTVLAGDRIDGPLAASVVQILSDLRAETVQRSRQWASSARLAEAIDLVLTSLVGVYRDELANQPEGFAAINDLDFREWLAKHGAAPATLDGGLLKGMYDLVFGYRGGDPTTPAFEAGTGLMLAGRFFFDYKGSLFWKMRAGMGESVFVPMYRELKRRGTEFRFFHRLEALHLDDSGRLVETVQLGRQARLADGVDEYLPLVQMLGNDGFPSEPLLDQLEEADLPLDLESHEATRDTEDTVILRRGHDFDQVILAVSIGMLPHVCGEIIDGDHRWQQMVDNVSTVATESLQLWTRASHEELGWHHPGATVAGFESPFDTYADMSHLLAVEDHGDDPPASLGYFCSALADPIADEGREPAEEAVRQRAVEFMNERLGRHWPGAVGADGFRWDVLESGRDGEAALADQHYRANVDPSDRYVQSLPGTGKHRLRADDSGVENLFLAGDWIDSGLNAGCIEAAAIAGLQAANAAMGRPLCEGVLGGWEPVNKRSGSS